MHNIRRVTLIVYQGFSIGDLARAWVEITSRPVTRGASMCVGIAEFLSVGWQLGERWEPTLAGLQRTYNNAQTARTLAEVLFWHQVRQWSD
jgi:hypothetical protein